MAERLIKVYEVLHDTDGEGPAGDGTVIARFRDKREAERFASGNTCYGRQATAELHEVPRRIAQRWGMA